MKKEKQVISYDQSKRLSALCINAESHFLWYNDWRDNRRKLVVYKVPGHTYEGAEELPGNHWAYTLSEIMAPLKNNIPIWVAIWSEWGYAEKNGTKRGYGSFLEACTELLIHKLESGQLTAHDVNQAISGTA